MNKNCRSGLLNELGVGVTEILMVMAVTAIGATAIATLTASSLKATAHGMDKQQFFRVSQNVQSLILSDKNWRQTLLTGYAFQCIRSTSTPANDCCSGYAPSACNPGKSVGGVQTRDPNYVGPSFSLYDSNSKIIQPDTNASQFKTSGYNSKGEICTGFDAVNGNDACPLQLKLTWEAADCTGSPCVNPMVRVVGRYTYAPKTSARSLINPAFLNFTIIRPPLPPAVQAGGCYRITCTSLSGVTRTLTANISINNIAVAEAPSNQSAWVIEFSNLGTLKSAFNCFDDNQGGVPHNYSGISNCRNYGTLAGQPGQTFNAGMANPFSSCQTPAECP